MFRVRIKPLNPFRQEIDIDKSVIGTIKPFGEYIPLATGLPLVLNDRTKDFLNYHFQDLRIKFGQLSKDMTYDVESMDARSVLIKDGKYYYRLYLSGGFIMDFKSKQPLIVMCVLPEYYEVPTSEIRNYPLKNIVLCVHYKLKRSRFLRSFLKLYPFLQDKLVFLPTLSGFIERIDLKKVKGELLLHQENIIKLFLEEIHSNEFLLSGKQDKLFQT